MTAYKKIFIDSTDFYDLVTSGTNTYAIWLNPMEFHVTHDGTTLGLQTLSLQGTAYTEVVFSALDSLSSIGKYTVDPTSNSVIIILDKVTVTTDAAAKNYITGMLLEYQMKTLEYASDDALYTMETYASDGTYIGETRMSSTSTLLTKMLNYDSEQDVNSVPGPFVHSFRRALVVS